LADVVAKAMAVDPNERFSSVHALGRALLDYTDERGQAVHEKFFKGVPPMKKRPPELTGDTTAVQNILRSKQGSQATTVPHEFPFDLLEAPTVPFDVKASIELLKAPTVEFDIEAMKARVKQRKSDEAAAAEQNGKADSPARSGSVLRGSSAQQASASGEAADQGVSGSASRNLAAWQRLTEPTSANEAVSVTPARRRWLPFAVAAGVVVAAAAIIVVRGARSGHERSGGAAVAPTIEVPHAAEAPARAPEATPPPPVIASPPPSAKEVSPAAAVGAGTVAPPTVPEKVPEPSGGIVGEGSRSKQDTSERRRLHRGVRSATRPTQAPTERTVPPVVEPVRRPTEFGF
jgi:hypothetical protein